MQFETGVETFVAEFRNRVSFSTGLELTERIKPTFAIFDQTKHLHDIMGKGDKKSGKGKRFMGSYGKTRKRKKKKSTAAAPAKKKAALKKKAK